MVSVGSLPVSGSQIFDLDTQSGVMHILASLRTSDISTEHKSEIRDLVFLYTNGGKDQTVRLALEQKITAYGVVAAPTKAKVGPKKEEPPQPTIGKFRTAPSFRVHDASAPTTPVAAVVPEPVFVPTPYSVKEPTPTREPVSTPVQIYQETTPQPAPEPAVAPSPAQPPESAIPVATMAHPVDDKQYLDRIREIKAAVNERVGNPVNLVDINNEVGREYMGAILDAMKKLNSGTSAASAMKRLEEAYAAVLHTLEDRAAHSAAAVSEPAAFVPSAPEPVFVPEPVSPPVAQVAYEPAPAPVSLPHYEPEVETEPLPAYQPLSGGPKTGRLQIQDATPAESPATPVWEAPKPAPFTTPVPEPSSAWEQAPATTHAVSTAQFAPLSDLPEKPLSIDDLPTSESLQSSATAGDPLFTLEVDEGLNQLLFEWSIFKKSGMFGTGPKGKEHPLFKKMGPLHIPLILAGRFEGATQEIKQSVTDYMNGWRYEQGLIYQQGETFEHYLRRVIRHILDLQKR
jgi:hypothetical protein